MGKAAESLLPGESRGEVLLRDVCPAHHPPDVSDRGLLLPRWLLAALDHVLCGPAWGNAVRELALGTPSGSVRRGAARHMETRLPLLVLPVSRGLRNPGSNTAFLVGPPGKGGAWPGPAACADLWFPGELAAICH